MPITSHTLKPSILLVDDEPEILDLLGRQLTNRQFKTYTASSGKEALNILESEQIDILVTDVRMPGMDGIELLETAKGMRPELEAIVITGHGDLDTALSAMRLGAYNFLPKPVGIAELAITLDNCVEKISLKRKVEMQRDKLQRVNDDLEHRVAQRTTELTRANGLLAEEIELHALVIQDLKEKDALLRHSQKMEALGSLAGGIAHDFNNLLMGIQGYSSLLIANCDANDLGIDHLFNIEKLVASGGRLTRQLLGFVRQGQFNVKPVDLHTLIGEVLTTLSRTKKNIRFETELCDQPCILDADQGQIEQILFNLCINGADAMAGGGILTLCTEVVAFPLIEQKLHKDRPGDYIHLTVQDTGIGITPEIMDKIFEPFFTTKDVSRGTGLGLASTYGIIASYDGCIEVDSKTDLGTVFHIYLPRSKNSSELSGKSCLLTSRPVAGTILLVDDDDDIRETTRELLESRGFEVLTAYDGEKALAMYQKHDETIDIVVLDMIMPNMGGSEAFDKLMEINPQVKVLLSTGYSLEGQAADIVNKGCAGYIQKPFNIADLTRKIMEII
ncbi:MAG: response regulator [Desulfobulbaceae bacterium]|jgi:CheY-like chemotaxis protein|nr:response regulator [Desulfobulbaceae bacterium]